MVRYVAIGIAFLVGLTMLGALFSAASSGDLLPAF